MLNESLSWISLMPPIITIILVLMTKESVFSLVLGGFVGCIIYNGGHPISALDMFFCEMSRKMSENVYIILFLALLGALVSLMEKSGGALAYGKWISKKIKTKKGTQLSTVLLGTVIFIDDYFNCLTVGTVMRPIFDRYRISREKLAYIIDAMAVSLCIITPISSWAAIILSTLEGSGVKNSFGILIRSIPYNFYAIFTVIMVLSMIILNLDFGPMYKYEKASQSKIAKAKFENNNMIQETIKGKGRDLLIPIGVLIVSTVIILLYNGGYFSGDVTILKALKDTDSAKSLTYGALIALVCSFLLMVVSDRLNFKEYMEGVTDGVKTMVSAYMILILAWTIGGICQKMGTGDYVKYIIETTNVPRWILPMLIFVVSGFLSFSTGTSWGSFGILIPVVVEIAKGLGENSLIIFLAATLAGATYGDHSSPISDTCILSSVGAQCEHIDHVISQIPYALIVAVICCLNYIMIDFVGSLVISYIVGVVLMLMIMVMVARMYEKKYGKII